LQHTPTSSNTKRNSSGQGRNPLLPRGSVAAVRVCGNNRATVRSEFLQCTAELAAVALTGCPAEPVPASQGCSKPTIPRRVSQAAWFSAGSDPTRSRIICQAAMLRAPSGGGPIARETEHGEQKQIRRAADFWRGLIPTVCANINTPTDLCPVSSSRLQRRQHRCSKGPPPGGQLPQQNTVFAPWRAQVDRKVPASLNSSFKKQPHTAVAVQARSDSVLRRYAVGNLSLKLAGSLPARTALRTIRIVLVVRKHFTFRPLRRKWFWLASNECEG